MSDERGQKVSREVDALRQSDLCAFHFSSSSLCMCLIIYRSLQRKNQPPPLFLSSLSLFILLSRPHCVQMRVLSERDEQFHKYMMGLGLWNELLVISLCTLHRNCRNVHGGGIHVHTSAVVGIHCFLRQVK